MSNPFWQGPIYGVVKAMRATGNRAGVIAQWKEQVEAWASTAAGPDAEAARAWLPLWHVRPVYTAAELVPLFTVLPVTLGLTSRMVAPRSSARLANELVMAGLPRAWGLCAMPVKFPPANDYYFFVERLHRYRERHFTHEEFMREFFNV